jgi:hypothetical protein
MVILKKLHEIPKYCLITMPRGGSEYFQSLIDGHSEVIVYILNFRFFTEYIKSSKVYSISLDFDIVDFIDEFIGCQIDRFATRYEKNERLDELGYGRNESININREEFKKHFITIIGNEDKNVENIFLSIYGAYTLSLNRDISKVKILFHHAHTVDEAVEFGKRFPNSKLLYSIRDPRASFTSANINVYLKSFQIYNYKYFCDILVQLSPFKNRKTLIEIKTIFGEIIPVYLELLSKEKYLNELAFQMGINYESTMKLSTWGGLVWWGDKQSLNPIDPTGKDRNKIDRLWRKKLSKKDQYIFNIIFNNLLKTYNYEVKKIYFFDYFFCFLLIFTPFKFEIKLFSMKFIIRKLKYKSIIDMIHLFSTPLFYFKARYILYRHLIFQVNNVWLNYYRNI